MECSRKQLHPRHCYYWCFYGAGHKATSQCSFVPFLHLAPSSRLQIRSQPTPHLKTNKRRARCTTGPSDMSAVPAEGLMCSLNTLTVPSCRCPQSLRHARELLTEGHRGSLSSTITDQGPFSGHTHQHLRNLLLLSLKKKRGAKRWKELPEIT